MGRKKVKFLFDFGEFSSRRPGLTRRAFLQGLGLASLTSVPLLSACTRVDGESKAMELEREKELAQAGPISGSKIPPVDTTAPSETKTATFALG
jgi:hypothetical protein